MVNYQKAFEAVVTDQRYLANLDWGEPREGHSEGTVRAHIAEIEPNLEILRPKLSDENYWKLKLLIHTHDSFKGEAQPSVPITDARSHASLARAFLAVHCTDDDLLAMCSTMTSLSPFIANLKRGKYNQDRFDALMRAIRD